MQSGTHTLGLTTGQHIQLMFIDKQGQEIERSYTPVSTNSMFIYFIYIFINIPSDDLGFVDFVIKIYMGTEAHPEGNNFPFKLIKLIYFNLHMTIS